MISAFFINRPIVSMVIAILTVILGVLALLGLPLAQFPQIVPPQINVSTTYTGADAITIEQSVSAPIEQQVSGVKGMLYMLSTNANDGTQQLSVTFDISTDPNIDDMHGIGAAEIGTSQRQELGDLDSPGLIGLIKILDRGSFR